MKIDQLNPEVNAICENCGEKLLVLFKHFQSSLEDLSEVKIEDDTLCNECKIELDESDD